MVRSLLIRGMLVGAVAGVLAFVFALLFGEPQVDKAIAFEEHLAKLAHESEGSAVVSRDVQRGSGLFVGMLATGIAIGGLFSLVFAYAHGRMGEMRPRVTAALLAAMAYLTIILVPFTKYPANPPSVGSPDTIDKRTVLFLTMIAISVLAAVGAARIRRAFLDRLGGWNATVIALGAYLATIALAELILPAVHETPAGFPAAVLYQFRLASLGINMVMWGIIGIGFGYLAERLLAPTRDERPAAAPAAASGQTT